jgi:hypothetical protein
MPKKSFFSQSQKRPIPFGWFLFLDFAGDIDLFLGVRFCV